MAPWSKYDPKKICASDLAALVKNMDPITAYTQEDFFDFFTWWHKIPEATIKVAASLENKRIICMVSHMDSPERAYDLMLDIQSEGLAKLLEENCKLTNEVDELKQDRSDYDAARMEIQRLKAEIYDLRFEAERG